MTPEDRERLEIVTQSLGGDEEALRELTRRSLGTRDLDEADRRARVVMEYRSEADQ